MSRFKAILWDIGGVVLTNGWDHNERKNVFDTFGFDDRAAFEARHEAENDAWEKGTITFDQYLERTLFTEPRPFSPAEIKKAIEDESKLLEDSAMPILKDLHARGEVIMGQLNNESRELNDIRIARFGLTQYLSLFLCSGYVGLRKPSPAMYRLGAEVLQKAPGEIVFVDDREANVAAAAASGLHAIQYKGSAALRTAFEQLELL